MVARAGVMVRVLCRVRPARRFVLIGSRRRVTGRGVAPVPALRRRAGVGCLFAREIGRLGMVCRRRFAGLGVLMEIGRNPRRVAVTGVCGLGRGSRRRIGCGIGLGGGLGGELWGWFGVGCGSEGA